MSKKSDYSELKRYFNDNIAGRPIKEAQFKFTPVYTEYIEKGKADAVEKLFRELTLVRNLQAEKIAQSTHHKKKFVNITKIINLTTPKNMDKNQSISWREKTLDRILNDKLLTDSQRDLLLYRGIEYFPDGTVDLKPIRYRGINIKVERFAIFGGKLDRTSDHKTGLEYLSKQKIKIPEGINFHHHVDSRDEPYLLPVSKAAHDIIKHIGFSRFAKIETNSTQCPTPYTW
jgi:hypothetical protein